MICLTVVSYCQRELLISYLIGYTYTVIRSYFIFPLGVDRAHVDHEHKMFAWVRFNCFILMAYTASYIFSRRYHQRERDQFIEK
jgi:uncharacterized membrane protein